ncbi:hypothetical protein MVES1_000184 [Malassezia vespertilionis]|uniref:EF-hand domain-containing protein n=1 Tax=Malassezia vespertilionis TaxID=2020962 RepID=A0A2N1JHA3_9BASI|nr:uncharacterized protein MVES1_000184 [Malassezia vespertilionis]PKI85915.1 hypothetical protein MVES_000180 [Malassezia vespertilionis]WFD04860.1 hypothetical protein MVES1_000184 [Malassezia vespertilionis]
MSDAAPLASLSPAQIKQLQRVFYTLDRDHDDIVSEADVATQLRGLGTPNAAEEAKAYIGQEGGSLDATSYMTMMATKLAPLSDARKLADAFESFDEKDAGFVDVALLKEIFGDTPELLQPWLTPAFLDRSCTRFEYRKCTWMHD